MRTLHTFLVLAAAVGITVAACSSDTAPADADIAGSWGLDFNGTPGNVFAFTLGETDGVIAGSGSFAGEAGPSGPLSVSGTIANDVVHLLFVEGPSPQTGLIGPDTLVFDGRLVSRDKLAGVQVANGFTDTITFTR